MYKTHIVIAHMMTPVITDGFAPLDGALFYVQNLVEKGFPLFSMPNAYSFDVECKPSMPIGVRERNEEWYYECSFAFWEQPIAHDTTHMAKRFDAHHAEKHVDFKGRRGFVHLDKGPFKNYFIEDFCVFSRKVAWLIRCDEDWLLKMLPLCTCIGKKSAHGNGAVLKWEVHKAPFEYDDFIGGRQIRSLPSQNADMEYGIRPSYWHPSNIVGVDMCTDMLTFKNLYLS